MNDIEVHKDMLLRKVNTAKDYMNEEVRKIKLFESNVEKEIVRVIE